MFFSKKNKNNTQTINLAQKVKNVPYYLENHLLNVEEKNNTVIGTLASSSGNTNLEIYYYGDTMKIKGTPYIIDSEYPCLIVAKDPTTNEEFTVFDGAKHGYDAMFCNEPCENAQRELLPYETYSGKIQIALNYSIDYEEEKEDYKFNENGEVVLTYGAMEWEKAKTIGFDWISMSFIDAKKEFVDLELA